MSFQKRAGRSQSKDEGASVRSLSPEKLESRARNVLLFQLAKSAKTRFQLAQVLQRREIPDEIAQAVLDRFEESGLINDRACAETVVAARLSAKPVAKSQLRRELARRGVAADIADDVLSQLTEEDERENAAKLAEKRWRSMGELADEVKTRRLLGFMMRRGYSAGVAHAAIRLAKSQE